MEMLNMSAGNITSSLKENTMANNLFEISSNWIAVDSTKKLENVISSELAINSSLRMTLDDIVNEDRCLEITPKIDNAEGCTVEIKIKNNKKIIRIGVVSEASVLEIFRDAGEYATTTFAEFIDEFEGATVYYGEVTFDRPTTEASIKFRRIKNNNRITMFLYGIRIIVDEIVPGENSPEQLLDFNLINDLLKMTMSGRNKKEKKDDNRESYIDRASNSISTKPLNDWKKKFTSNNNEKENETKTTVENESAALENKFDSQTESLEISVNIQLQQMERRFMNRINLLEANTNKKLNDIMTLLEQIKNNSS